MEQYSVLVPYIRYPEVHMARLKIARMGEKNVAVCGILPQRRSMISRGFPSRYILSLVSPSWKVKVLHLPTVWYVVVCGMQPGKEEGLRSSALSLFCPRPFFLLVGVFVYGYDFIYCTSSDRR